MIACKACRPARRALCTLHCCLPPVTCHLFRRLSVCSPRLHLSILTPLFPAVVLWLVSAPAVWFLSRSFPFCGRLSLRFPPLVCTLFLLFFLLFLFLPRVCPCMSRRCTERPTRRHARAGEKRESWQGEEHARQGEVLESTRSFVCSILASFCHPALRQPPISPAQDMARLAIPSLSLLVSLPGSPLHHLSPRPCCWRSDGEPRWSPRVISVCSSATDSEGACVAFFSSASTEYVPCQSASALVRKNRNFTRCPARFPWFRSRPQPSEKGWVT